MPSYGGGRSNLASPGSISRSAVREVRPKLPRDVTPVGNAPMATLRDSFNFADTTKWTFGVATVTGGQLSETLNSAYSGRIDSIAPYDLTGSALSVALLQRGNLGAGTTETFLQLYSNQANVNDSAVGFEVTGTNLITYYNVAGARTTNSTATYDAAAHKWWRIRESGGTVLWDTSPDGSTWTNLTTWVPTIAIASMYVLIGAGAPAAETTPGTAIWDNVNLAAPVSTLTEDFTTQDATKWNWSAASPGGAVSVSGGQLSLTSSTSGTASAYSGYFSNGRYELTGSSVFVQVVSVPAFVSGSSAETLFTLSDTANLRCHWGVSNGQTLFARVIDAVDSNQVYIVNVTYDPAVHKFLRFRESAGVIYADYSTDGATWVNLGDSGTLTNTWTWGPVQIGLMQGHYADEGAKTGVFDNVNTVPGATSSTLTATAAATASTTSSQTVPATLSATAGASATAGVLVTHPATLSATAGASATIVPLTSSALDATGTASAATTALVTHPVAVSSIGAATASLTGAQTVPSALSATALASASITGLKTDVGALSATAAGSATLAGLSTITSAASATAGATAQITVQGTQTSAIAATAGASAAVTGLKTVPVALSATGAASATVAALVTHPAALTASAATTATLTPSVTVSTPLAATGSATAAVRAGATSPVGATGSATAALVALNSSPAALDATASASVLLAGTAVRLGLIAGDGRATASLVATGTALAALVATALATVTVDGDVAGPGRDITVTWGSLSARELAGGVSTRELAVQASTRSLVATGEALRFLAGELSTRSLAGTLED